MNAPTLCNRAAYRFFARQLEELNTMPGLVRAAIAISMHALDDVQPLEIERQLDALAQRASRRVRGDQLQARLAHLHEVLFEEEGYCGNLTAYYSPLNSYLPAVMESRQGIPVTLCLVYAAVAHRMGLRVVGLNTPLHFLVEIRTRRERMIVDPFVRGRVLSVAEVHQLLYRSAGGVGMCPPAQLPVATHRQWLARIIGNLQHIFARAGYQDDFAAMTELQDALQLRPREKGLWPMNDGGG